MNRGFLSGRFLDYSLTRIRLAPTARNDILRKRANRAKQQCISVLTCRGLHCKPVVPMLFSCPSVDRSRTFSTTPSGGRAMRAPTPTMDIFRTIAKTLTSIYPAGNQTSASPRPKLSTFNFQLSTKNTYLSSREPNVGTNPTCLPDRNSQLSTLNSQLKNHLCLSTFSPSSIPSHRASISSFVLNLEKLTLRALSARSLLSPIALSTWLGLPLAQALPEDT